MLVSAPDTTEDCRAGCRADLGECCALCRPAAVPTATVLRPTPGSVADVRADWRSETLDLHAALDKAGAPLGGSPVERIERLPHWSETSRRMSSEISILTYNNHAAHAELDRHGVAKGGPVAERIAKLAAWSLPAGMAADKAYARAVQLAEDFNPRDEAWDAADLQAAERTMGLFANRLRREITGPAYQSPDCVVAPLAPLSWRPWPHDASKGGEDAEQLRSDLREARADLDMLRRGLSKALNVEQYHDEHDDAYRLLLVAKLAEAHLRCMDRATHAEDALASLRDSLRDALGVAADMDDADLVTLVEHHVGEPKAPDHTLWLRLLRLSAKGNEALTIIADALGAP